MWAAGPWGAATPPVASQLSSLQTEPDTQVRIIISLENFPGMYFFVLLNCLFFFFSGTIRFRSVSFTQYNMDTVIHRILEEEARRLISFPKYPILYLVIS